MKFEIYKPESKLATTTLLALSKPMEEVSIIAVDSNGDKIDCGNIIVINRDGTFRRSGNISKELGLKLDKQGRIVERKA